MKLLTIGMIFFTAQAIAVTQENVLVIPKGHKVYEDSSEYHRMNKSFQLTGQLAGLNPSGLVGNGISAGFFIDRQSMVVAEATGAGTKQSFLGSSYDVTGSSFGIHYKRFFGNSFYFRAGVDQRHVDYKYNFDGIFSSDYSTSSSFVVDSTAAALVIGNQWQWGNFTLGCDWIGISAPFVTKFSQESYSANADEIDRNRQERDKDYFGKKTIAQALRFYLGASF